MAPADGQQAAGPGGPGAAAGAANQSAAAGPSTSANAAANTNTNTNTINNTTKPPFRYCMPTHAVYTAPVPTARTYIEYIYLLI